MQVELSTLKNNNARLTSALQESTSNVEEWKRQLHNYKVGWKRFDKHKYFYKYKHKLFYKYKHKLLDKYKYKQCQTLKSVSDSSTIIRLQTHLRKEISSSGKEFLDNFFI